MCSGSISQRRHVNIGYLAVAQHQSSLKILLTSTMSASPGKSFPLDSRLNYYCPQSFSMWWTTATTRWMWTHFLSLQICSIPSSPVSCKSDAWKLCAPPVLTSPLTANQASGAASWMLPTLPSTLYLLAWLWLLQASFPAWISASPLPAILQFIVLSGAQVL